MLTQASPVFSPTSSAPLEILIVQGNDPFEFEGFFRMPDYHSMESAVHV